MDHHNAAGIAGGVVLDTTGKSSQFAVSDMPIATTSSFRRDV
jgi:hypothetical protein